MDARASSRRRRLGKNKKKAAAAAEPPLPGPASIHIVPDDLVKLILLRLDSSLWLLRAASTCKRWRGIVTADDGGTAFLRLFRALYQPAILGHYHLDRETTEFIPTSLPPPSIETIRRLSSLDFLPADKAKWEVIDSHGGLVLLRDPHGDDLVVCDPIARSRQGILHPTRQMMPWYHSFAGAILLEGDGGGISMWNFRVLYWFKHDLRVFLFSTAEDGDWRLVDAFDGDPDLLWLAHVAGRIDGSLVLGVRTGRIVVLDNASLEFSRIDLPTSTDPSDVHDPSSFRVVHSSGGAAMAPWTTVRIVHVCGQELEVFRRVDGVWVLEHMIPRLSEAISRLPGHRETMHECEAVATGAGFVVLSTYHGGHGNDTCAGADLHWADVPIHAAVAATACNTLLFTFSNNLKIT